MLRSKATIFALGMVSALGFEPWSLWLLSLISLALLFRHMNEAQTWRQAASIGWWFGLGLGCISLTWLAHAFTYQSAMPHWLGWPAVALLAAYTACYWAFSFGAAKAVTCTSGPTSFALASAALFVLSEWLRGVFLTGFPWDPLGVIWLPTEVARAAATIGGLGLSGLTIAITGLLAAATRRDGTSARLLIPAVIVLPFALTGHRAAPDTGAHISLVQANIDQADKWQSGKANEQLERYIVLSGSSGTIANRRLVFWPEAAIIDPLDTETALRVRAAAILGPRDLLFTGATGEAGEGRYTNSVFIINALGNITGRYDKSILVPFGEYLPLSGLMKAIGISRLVPGDVDFAAGTGPRTLNVGELKLGVAICYEVVFASSVVDRRHRPQFLFNPSNDAWFGKGGPEQHLAQARLRAIEEGLPVIRVTPTGITAVIRSDGTILAKLPAQKAGRLDTFMPSAGTPTAFSRWGSGLALTAAIAILGMLLSCRLLHRRTVSYRR